MCFPDKWQYERQTAIQTPLAGRAPKTSLQKLLLPRGLHSQWSAGGLRSKGLSRQNAPGLSSPADFLEWKLQLPCSFERDLGCHPKRMSGMPFYKGTNIHRTRILCVLMLHWNTFSGSHAICSKGIFNNILEVRRSGNKTQHPFYFMWQARALEAGAPTNFRRKKDVASPENMYHNSNSQNSQNYE